MRCRHRGKWENVQAQFFAPPNLEGKVALESPNADAALKMHSRLFEGYTVLTQQCAKCSEVRSIELRGNVSLEGLTV